MLRNRRILSKIIFKVTKLQTNFYNTVFSKTIEKASNNRLPLYLKYQKSLNKLQSGFWKNMFNMHIIIELVGDSI